MDKLDLHSTVVPVWISRMVGVVVRVVLNLESVTSPCSENPVVCLSVPAILVIVGILHCMAVLENTGREWPGIMVIAMHERD